MDYIPINMLTLSPSGFMTNTDRERRGAEKHRTRAPAFQMRDRKKEENAVMLIDMKAYLNSIHLQSNTKALTAVKYGVCSVNYL